MTTLVAPVRYAPHIGGIETLLAHIMPTLRELGHEFVVVTGTDEDATTAEVIDGIPVYRFPFQHVLQSSDPGRMLEVGARLRQIEAEHGVHLRHVHGLDFAIWFVLRRHLRRPLPLLVSVHGTLDAPHPYSPLTTQTLCAADVVTAVSESVRSSLETTVPELDGRVRVIRNGLAFDHVPDAGPEPGRILAAGRLDWLKGFDLAIHAIASLRGTQTDARLRIAGDGREESRLRALAAELGVDDRVTFLGPCSQAEVLEEIARASVVVVPSRAIEGFSLIALEAAHLGRPVIATNVGGLPETVVDGVTGVLVRPDDHLALAAALDDLLAAPGALEQLGTAARHLAGRFDATHCAAEYAALYDTFTPASGLLGGVTDRDTSMTPESATYRVRGQHVTHERLDDEVIAIDLDRGYYFAMVGPAADIWTAVVGGADAERTIALLAPRYGVEPSAVGTEIAAFVSTLVDEGLVVAHEPGDGDTDADAVPVLPDLVAPTPWSAPELERYDDMADLVLLDPIHQVDESGWPHLPPES